MRPRVGCAVFGSGSSLRIGEDRARSEDHNIGKDLGSQPRDALEPASTQERERPYKTLVENGITRFCQQLPSGPDREEPKMCRIEDPHLFVSPDAAGDPDASSQRNNVRQRDDDGTIRRKQRAALFQYLVRLCHMFQYISENNMVELISRLPFGGKSIDGRAGDDIEAQG